MAQESTTDVSPSSSTGTLSDLCGAMASFSVKHHGIDSADSPLCASAIRVRQQYGLNGRVSSLPTSSNSFRAIENSPRHHPVIASQRVAMTITVMPRLDRDIQYAVRRV